MQDKECFTLSEFIPPEVARKINSCDVAGADLSISQRCSTDSESLAQAEKTSGDNSAVVYNEQLAQGDRAVEGR